MNTDRIKAVAAALVSALVAAGVLDVGQGDAVNGVLAAGLALYAAIAVHPPRLRGHADN